MRRLAPPAVLALLAACAGYTRPVLVDEEAKRPSARPEVIEAQARDRIRKIEDQIARGDLPKVNFEFDKDEIMAESYPTLDRIVEVMESSPRLKLMIQAHTDDVGSDEYNLELSKRRAKAVDDYLSRRGVPPPSMRYRGYGSSKPVADNGTEEGRAKNRRVEFYVTARSWDAVY
ncbi:MAG: OmpA family protein [Elusimicrobiota bacterium]